MNRSYNIIFNCKLGIWQVASERTRSKGKSKSSVVRKTALLTVALSASMVTTGWAEDNLLVGSGGSSVSASPFGGSGGGGGIGGGGGGRNTGAGGGGISGGSGTRNSLSSPGGDGAVGGSGSGAGGAGGIGGGGGGLGTSGGGGAIGGAGGSGRLNDGGTAGNGSDGAGGNGVGATAGQGNLYGGGGGGDGDSGGGGGGRVVDGNGNDISGKTSGAGASGPSSLNLTDSRSYGFVGVGGGGAGGGGIVNSGADGTAGNMTLGNNATLSITRSFLIGGGGGGGAFTNLGGSGGNGTVAIGNGRLSVVETLLIGGSGGGGSATSNGAIGNGGNGGDGTLTLDQATLAAGNLLVGGNAGGGGDSAGGGNGGDGGAGNILLRNTVATITANVQTGGNGGTGGGVFIGTSNNGAIGGNGGDATLAFDHATLSASGNMVIGGSGGVGGEGTNWGIGPGGNGGTGTATFDDSTITVAGNVSVGGRGGNGTSAFNLQTSSNGNGGSGGNASATLTRTTFSVGGNLLIGGQSGDGGIVSIFSPSLRGDGGIGGAGVFTTTDSTINVQGGRVILGGVTGANGVTTTAGTAGTGVLNLGSGSMNFSAGATFVINDNGTLNIGNAVVGNVAGGSIAGLGSLNNNGVINFNQADNSYILSSAISGTGLITQNSSGATILSGDNTYTGGTTINSGTLQIGNGGGSGSIAGDIGNNSLLSFNRSGTVSYAGVISGSGNLLNEGSGTTILSGTNTYTGTTTIAAGTLQLGNGGTTGSVAGNITNNGILIFNRSDSFNYADLISGSGSVIKNGSNTITLTSAQTYTGGTTIGAGTLALSGSGNLAASGGISIAGGGTFDVSAANGNRTVGALSGNAGSTVQLGSNTLFLGDAATTVFAGVISGGGGIIKQGSGTTIYAGNNNYSGGTMISAGTLQIGNGGSSGSVANNITNNATLAFNRNDTFTYAGVISGSGNLLNEGSGTTILSGTNTYTGTTTIAAGTLQLGNGGTTGSVAGNITNNGILIFNRSDSFTYSNIISGSGNLVKSGSGTLSIVGSNVYTGNTTVRAGTLQFDSYTQSASSAFGVTASSNTDYGKLVVTGVANLPTDGKINVDVASVNTLALRQVLSDVISAGTLNASSFSVTDNSVLFNFRAAINGNAVDLTVIPGVSVYDAVTNNGASAASGAARILDDVINNGATGDMNTVVTALGSLTNQGEVSRAANQTLPALNSGVTQVSKGVLNSVNRLIENRPSVGNSGLSGGDDFSNCSAWFKPFGSRADQNDRDGVSGFNATTWGLAGGIEGDLSRSTRLGIAYAYANSKVDGNTSLSGSQQHVDIDAHVLALYGTTELVNDITLEFQGDIGQNSNDGTRHINFGGLDRTATSDYKTYTAHVGLSVAKTLTMNERTSFTPTIRADYTWLQDESYRERGADALNLDVAKHSSDAFVLGADARISHVLTERSRMEANAGIGYDTINKPGNVVASYAGTPGQVFATQGIEHSPWLFAGGIGYVYNTVGGTEISVRYDVEGRSDYTNQSASVKAKWVF